jgi:fatty acid desaturase
MTKRGRIIAFGTAGALVLAGVVCAIVVGGLIGQLLTFVLIAFGLGGAVLLLFYEVGLSEDRDRAREERAKEARERAAEPKRGRPRLQPHRWRRRPG